MFVVLTYAYRVRTELAPFFVSLQARRRVGGEGGGGGLWGTPPSPWGAPGASTAFVLTAARLILTSTDKSIGDSDVRVKDLERLEYVRAGTAKRSGGESRTDDGVNY